VDVDDAGLPVALCRPESQLAGGPEGHQAEYRRVARTRLGAGRRLENRDQPEEGPGAP
jgi:hypothetical protein